MLAIAGTITIDPANREKAIEAAVWVMAETRKEPGNIEYVFSADLEDPAVFRLFEQWESQAALDEHFATPHMARFQGLLGGLGVKDVSVQKYQIASVGPVR